MRDADDAEFITVEDTDESVRVAKEGDNLIIKVDDRYETVDMKIKLDVVEAMLSGDPDDLDLMAMLKALEKQGEQEIITVHSEDETVRIWIDTDSSSD